MPIITLIGSTFIILGLIFVAFTPRERVVQVVSAPAWGTMITVSNASGTEAAGAAVPYGESGKILSWDEDRKIYHWIDQPTRKE